MPDRHSTFAEGAFLNTYVIQQIHGFLMTDLKFNAEDARRALVRIVSGSEELRICFSG